MSLAQIAWPVVRLLLSAVLPNVLLFLVLLANITWWNRVAPLGYVGAPWNVTGAVWVEVAVMMFVILAIDIAAIYLFARSWRKRRWGQKPDAVERASRYVLG